VFKTREEETFLIKHKHQQLLKMFRDTLTKVSNLKQKNLDIQGCSRFMAREGSYEFDITVFGPGNINTSLTIYDFWEIKASQKLVDTFLSAIKTGDYEKVKTVR
jgi:hypothetical protein